MSFNGSGTYSLPAGNPVVTGTTISSSTMNTTLSDIATALSLAYCKDGQSTPTANLPMGSYKLTGLGAGTAAGHSVRWEQLFSQGSPTDIASAATCDIGAATTNFLQVTGTTTITSFGTNYNGPKMLRFAGALTLTYNATTLLTPGAANITTAAGDTCVLIPKSTVSGTADGWQVIAYQRATGGNFLTTDAPYRNRVINGTMQVDQRNAGAAQTITAGAALAYTVDRFYAYCTGANVTGQQITASDSTKRYQFTGAASVSAIGFGHRIEAANSLDLAGNTCTLSVKLKNSLLTSVSWAAYYANSSDSFGSVAVPTRTSIASGTFTVSNTEATYTTQISVPAAAVTGIEILFTVGAQTSGIWQIGDVQLEKGAIPASALSVERVNYLDLLMRCRRYYESWTNDSGSNQNYILGYGTAGNAYTQSFTYTAPKRTAPTATTNGSNTNISSVNLYATSNNLTVQITPTATGDFQRSATNGQTWLTASAEL